MLLLTSICSVAALFILVGFLSEEPFEFSYKISPCKLNLECLRNSPVISEFALDFSFASAQHRKFSEQIPRTDVRKYRESNFDCSLLAGCKHRNPDMSDIYYRTEKN